MGLVSTFGVGQYASGFSSESHMAVWDRGYKTGGRAMLYGHAVGASSPQATEFFGFNADQSSIGGTAALQALTKAIASVIGPIMGGDQNGASWGNSTAQTMMTDAWAWVKTKYGAKTDSCIVAGLSMGGALALNWARANPTLVKAVVLFYPAVSVQGCYAATGGAANNSASINAAYGGSWSTNGGPAFDPGQNASSYTGVPIYMGYSDADTTVGTANQTAFISGVGGAALTARVYHNAAHADMSQVNANDLCSWLGAYL